MILILEGTPGSGKSHEAVCRIIDNLKLGRRVLTNIDGLEVASCREMICSLTGLHHSELNEKLVFLGPDQLGRFWELGQENDFFLIDEIQKYFNSRDFAKGNNRDFGNWASTHRHLGQDLIMISQRAERIESSVRSLAEFTYRYRKLNMFGSKMQSHYLQYVFAGDDTAAKPLSVSKRKYRKEIFACYQSYFGPDAKEKAVTKGINVLKHPIFYALAASIVFSLYFISKSSFIHGDVFGVGTAVASTQADIEKAAGKGGHVVKSENLNKTALANSSVTANSNDWVWIPVSGWIQSGEKIFVTVAGIGVLSRSQWRSLDKINRLALVKSSLLAAVPRSLDQGGG